MSRSITELDLSRLTVGSTPVLVHSDLMQARAFAPVATSRAAMLASHYQVLVDIAEEHSLWFACFNYDFTRTGVFHVDDSICQVGPLAEHVRKVDGNWRSNDPVFSVCGNGCPLPDPDSFDPLHAFGKDSVFQHLYERDGGLLFYGADFSSATILHFAESKSGGPVYRYDKDFTGVIHASDGRITEVIYRYHVRPLGMSLDYDWQKIQCDLVEAGLLHQQFDRAKPIASVCQVKPLVDFWVDRLRQDSLYFLDSATRSKIEKLNLHPSQRLNQSDYEDLRAA